MKYFYGDNTRAITCVVCQLMIPQARVRRGACTCSVECKKHLRRIRAEIRDKSICRYCGSRKRQKVPVIKKAPPVTLEPSSTPSLNDLAIGLAVDEYVRNGGRI
jgi:hypothetical protein